MSDLMWIALVAAVGAALGAANVLGLWWTVLHLRRTGHPGVVLGASFVLRTALAAAPVALLADGRLDRLVAGLGLLLVARAATMRALGPRIAPAAAGPTGEGAG